MLESRAAPGGRGTGFLDSGHRSALWDSAIARAVIDGAVAQLGERRVRNAKVEGSIPFRSTIKSMT